MRHYVNMKVKNVTEASACLIELFNKKAYNSDTGSRIISCLYKGLLNLKTHSTSYIKTKWEKEGGITISEKECTTIWRYQWKCTSSQEWRKFAWKNLITHLITPSHKFHNNNNLPICWRNCGNQNANHYHIFWDCPAIKYYWSGIYNALQDIFKCDMPLKYKTIYLGYIPQEWLKKDILMNILLMAGQKALTRNWLSQESPTLNAWMEITMDTHKMEKITACVCFMLGKMG